MTSITSRNNRLIIDTAKLSSRKYREENGLFYFEGRKLLEEARRQIEERGYKETTVRSVAAALSIGLGTLYNYFESKDMLVASFMLEDWSKSMAAMRESIDSSADSHEKLRLVFEGLRAFSERHKKLFSDPSARKTFAHTMQERHPLL